LSRRTQKQKSKIDPSASPNPATRLSFVGHLDELRKRIIWTLIAVAATAIIGYLVSGFILEVLSKPIGKLYFFAPAEAFLVRFKIAFIVGIGLALPFILYQAWRFISPALKTKEKKYAVPVIFTAFLLFCLGVAFAYFLLIPVGLKVLLSFGSENVVSLMNVSKYFSFILWFLLFAGILFEMPLLILFLAKLGIIEPRTLRKHRRTAIVIIFIASAVLTPSVDMITMLILALPLILLYEVSIWIAHFTQPKPARAKKK
jgi:sec-independent protein translocase protein TatC